MTKFNGPFANHLQEFVDFKKKLGFKYETESKSLRKFDEMTIRLAISDSILTKDLCDAWCSGRPYENDRISTQKRVSCLRQFALYLFSTGKETYIPVSVDHNISHKSKYAAYIFTHEEISRIITCSDEVFPHRRSTMHLVMPVLVRLLYSTGMRIMEALLLRIKQIDLEEGIIHVEHAKFDKERLIPLSSSMLAILRQYYDIMHPHSSPDDFFFVGITRTPYTHHEVYIRFRELLQQACIPHAGRGNGPRIHDLRHTFCCHTLQQSVANGQDMNAFLPILSEYLGHESLTATSQYLKMTAEVYPDILKSVEGLCSRAIPEVSR